MHSHEQKWFQSWVNLRKRSSKNKLIVQLLTSREVKLLVFKIHLWKDLLFLNKTKPHGLDVILKWVTVPKIGWETPVSNRICEPHIIKTYVHLAMRLTNAFALSRGSGKLRQTP